MVSSWRPTAKVDAVRIDMTREYVKVHGVERPEGVDTIGSTLMQATSIYLCCDVKYL